MKRWSITALLLLGLWLGGWNLVSSRSEPVQTTLSGPVIAIKDGDTLDLLVDEQPVRVRVAHIDAPEREQGHYQQAKQALAELCQDHTAVVNVIDKDRYQRLVGSVQCQGQDVATFMVRQGLAWVYEQYAPANSPLFDVEDLARSQGMGLWSDTTAIAPWTWRRQKRP